MNKTSSLIAILIASVGGFAVGHMVGKRSADDSGATTGAAVAVLEGDGLGERGEAHPEAGSDIARTRVPVTKDQDRKSTRLNSSHVAISYAVFCLKKKNK